MRTSILTRSVITTASLAIASVTLVAAPAGAKPTATADGVTREKVLAAAAALKTEDEATYVAGVKAIRSITHRACAIDIDNGEVVEEFYPIGLEPPTNADGVVVIGVIGNDFDNTYRLCVVGAVAATDPGFTLQGSSTLTAGTRTVTVPLSGDVTTTRIDPTADETLDALTFSAAGGSVKITTTPTTYKVIKKKTKVEKARAKRAYDKKLKTAKKTYTKALDKAGKSKSKKAAAKKAYAAKRAAAKAAYKYAIASYRIVHGTTSSTDARPFTLTMPQGSM
jgi:hypothetical protein